MNGLQIALRDICIPETEESILRMIGVNNGLLPAADVNYCSLNAIDIAVLQEQANANSWLQSPFEKDRFGRLHAKCTRINDDRGVINNDHVLSTT